MVLLLSCLSSQTPADSEARDSEVCRDAVVWFVDQDGDGWGSGDGVARCEAPEGHVDQAGDCDDSDPEVRPGEPETCDGVDQDCDGQVDEGSRRSFYVDQDGDGYGAGEQQHACEVPEDSSDRDDDCDDEDETVHPQAVEECDGGRDEDCDGLIDCEDGACSASPSCFEQDCTDGLDSDQDGLTDCEDEDCAGFLCGGDGFVIDRGSWRYVGWSGPWSGSSFRGLTVYDAEGQLLLSGASCSFTIETIGIYKNSWYSGSSVTGLSLSSGCPVSTSSWLPTDNAFGQGWMRKSEVVWIRGTATTSAHESDSGYHSWRARGELTTGDAWSL